MIYIADKFGFVSGFFQDTNIHGEQVCKAKHCLDVREAIPFKTRSEAERAYRKTYMADWWHCTLGTEKSDDNNQYPGSSTTQQHSCFAP